MVDDVSLEGTKEVDYNRLWYIHGQAYDLTDWLDKHPGEYVHSHSIYGPITSFNLVVSS
jgi:cytochrome b involved in lipid metabolism